MTAFRWPRLRWTAPPLENPVVLDIPETGGLWWSVPADRDAIVRLPAVKRHGAVNIEGGRSIVVRGGHITSARDTPAGQAGEQYRRCLHFGENPDRGPFRAGRVIHVEGVLCDSSGGGSADGLSFQAPSARAQVQRCRIIDLRGRQDDTLPTDTGVWCTHADVIQAWGGLAALRVDMLTGSSNCQGLTVQSDLAPVGSVEIRRTNIAYTMSSMFPNEAGTMLVASADQPVTLADVWIAPRPGMTLAQSVTLDSWKSAYRPVPSADGSSLTFPPRTPPVSGAIHLGRPPTGSFVPATAPVGLPYAGAR